MDQLVAAAGFRKLDQRIDEWGIFTVSLAEGATMGERHVEHPPHRTGQAGLAAARALARRARRRSSTGLRLQPTGWRAAPRGPLVVFGWDSASRSSPGRSFPIGPSTSSMPVALSLPHRRELDIHARRLLSAQAIAFVFFVAVPLRASFAKPATDGVAGFLFDLLGAFDLPFNQAPSLHVALTHRLAALCPPPAALGGAGLRPVVAAGRRHPS